MEQDLQLEYKEHTQALQSVVLFCPMCYSIQEINFRLEMSISFLFAELEKA